MSEEKKSYWYGGPDPIKIGLYVTDPNSPAAYIDCYQMAFDEAFEAGRINRPIKIVVKKENGLPNGSQYEDEKGFREFYEEGCIGVMCPNSSDNGIVLAPLANELKIPMVAWPGTARMYGEYTFRLANGDCGGNPAIVAQWVRSQGFTKAAVLAEVCPNGDEYFEAWRRESRRLGITMTAIETCSQSISHENLLEAMRRMKNSGAEVLVYMGYGYLFVRDMFRPVLKELDWNPPRITSTAFMFYLMGFDKFEGWVGVDQYCPENKRAQAFAERYEKRYGHLPVLWPNAIPLLAYDTGTAIAEALFRSTSFTREGLKDGLERLRWIPACSGGPSTHLSCSKYEHNIFSGDWLILSKIENGKLVYVGTHTGGGYE